MTKCSKLLKVAIVAGALLCTPFSWAVEANNTVDYPEFSDTTDTISPNQKVNHLKAEIAKSQEQSREKIINYPEPHRNGTFPAQKVETVGKDKLDIEHEKQELRATVAPKK